MAMDEIDEALAEILALADRIVVPAEKNSLPPRRPDLDQGRKTKPIVQGSFHEPRDRF